MAEQTPGFGRDLPEFEKSLLEGESIVDRACINELGVMALGLRDVLTPFKHDPLYPAIPDQWFRFQTAGKLVTCVVIDHKRRIPDVRLYTSFAIGDEIIDEAGDSDGVLHRQDELTFINKAYFKRKPLYRLETNYPKYSLRDPLNETPPVQITSTYGSPKEQRMRLSRAERRIFRTIAKGNGRDNLSKGEYEELKFLLGDALSRERREASDG